jgi:hypothetical protein
MALIFWLSVLNNSLTLAFIIFKSRLTVIYEDWNVLPEPYMHQQLSKQTVSRE